MALHAITGVMGSGKSHEAMKEKICPVLKDDDTRRVVTNIEGLNYEAIAEYVGRPLEDIQRRLVHVSYDRVGEPAFWHDPEGGEHAVKTQGPAVSTVAPTPPCVDSVVQPGDLVVIDEMWRYFNRGVKLPEDAMRFFRMHRHYSDPVTGHTCDVVLINQSMRGIHQDIRDVIEVQFNCRKLKVLGRPQNYQVFVIEGGERNASHNFLRKYDPKVFPLYSSYANKNAQETVDKRQSALSKPFFRVVLPLALLGIIAGSWFAYRYFSTMGKPKDAKPAVTAAPGQPSIPAAAPTAAPGPAFGGSPWRLASTYKVGNITVALLVNDKGVHRTAPIAEMQQTTGNDIAVKVPDERQGFATPFTGPAPVYGTQGVQAQAPGGSK